MWGAAGRGRMRKAPRKADMATEIEERRIGVSELQLGMYVCRLDRPWTETPFPLQGFLVDTPEQIARVAEYCTHVAIDELRSIDWRPEPHAVAPRKRAPERPKLPIGPPRPVRWRNEASVEDEAPHAREAMQHAEGVVARVIDDVRAGRKLSAQAVTEAVEPIVRSVLRNADAFFWVDSLRRRQEYAYTHAIHCSALAAALGRHMGYPQPTLVEFATGGLMLDVGKAALPEDLLQHAGPLDDAQRREMRSHLTHSLRILEQSGLRSQVVRQMVRTHHERHDGSGYPDGLAGPAIPLFGRVAGLIDTFDAMTSDRPHCAAQARHSVLQQLYRWGDTLFQSEVVEQMTQCLGVYPTGSLVELSTGEVAIVMAQNPARHLRPKVLVLTGADKQLDARFRTLDLMVQPEQAELSALVYIVRTLEPGSHGLDPTELYL